MKYRIKHDTDVCPRGPGVVVEVANFDEALAQADKMRAVDALSVGTQHGYWHRWTVRECAGKRRIRVLRLPNGKRWRR